MNKYITDQVITSRMAEKGWIEGCDDEHARNQVLAHYECEITDQWQNPDFSVYEESTADGYSVWIATADDKSINVSEDVYYYENELTDVVYEAIPDYDQIYCDNYDFVEDAITRHYEDLLCRIEDEIIDELLDEGYNHKIVNPINTLQYIQMISQDDQFNKDLPKLYLGFINITIDDSYKHSAHATRIIKDRDRYEIVANHYGLTIQRAVSGELIFEESLNYKLNTITS
jgi:hypothetical protein